MIILEYLITQTKNALYFWIKLTLSVGAVGGSTAAETEGALPEDSGKAPVWGSEGAEAAGGENAESGGAAEGCCQVALKRLDRVGIKTHLNFSLKEMLFLLMLCFYQIG